RVIDEREALARDLLGFVGSAGGRTGDGLPLASIVHCRGCRAACHLCGGGSFGSVRTATTALAVVSMGDAYRYDRERTKSGGCLRPQISKGPPMRLGSSQKARGGSKRQSGRFGPLST